MKWKDFTLRLRALVYRRQFEQDLQDELSSHIELQMRKNLAKGMEVAEARRQALIQFGGLQRVTEECRDARGVNWITTPFKDALYALRGFRRSPIFAIAAVATIALGLGIDTALFTVFNAYYFAPVNVRDPYSLYAIGMEGRNLEGSSGRGPRLLHGRVPGIPNAEPRIFRRVRLPGCRSPHE